MNTAYQIFKNKQNLEIRKVYNNKFGKLLDISRIPVYVVAPTQSELHEETSRISSAALYADKYLTSSDYPDIDPLVLFDTLNSTIPDKHLRREEIYIKHFQAYIMSGFGYNKKEIARFLELTTPAIDYIFDVLPGRIKYDSVLQNQISKFPEYIRAYIYRIYDDNLIYYEH